MFLCHLCARAALCSSHHLYIPQIKSKILRRNSDFSQSSFSLKQKTVTSLPSFLFRLLTQALKVAHTGETIKKT